jgi:flavin-dependent dehydrogenase
MTQRFEAVIIGGGGAGLMSAMIAGQRGRSVAVLEHNARIGKKSLFLVAAAATSPIKIRIRIITSPATPNSAAPR